MLEDKLENQEQNINNSAFIGAIEALLFVYGEPFTIKRIAKTLKTTEAIVKQSLEQLSQQYLSGNRGLQLLWQDEKTQLTTKPQFASLFEDLIREEFKEDLSPASLETLSLIAYLGPISRAQIDYYRGVNSTFILRSLLMRSLVERFSDPQRQNAYLYQASLDLLKHLGLSKIEELPDYEKYKTLKIREI